MASVRPAQASSRHQQLLDLLAQILVGLAADQAAELQVGDPRRLPNLDAKVHAI